MLNTDKKVAVFISNYSIGNSPSIQNILQLLSKYYHLDLFLKQVALTNVKVLKKNNIKVIQIKKRFSLCYLLERIKKCQSQYSFSICFDPHGFVFCREMLPQSKPFYYSLELYIKRDHYGLDYPKKVMEYERKEINSISGLIIQSEEKDKIFRNEYSLSENIPTFILPVTYTASSVKQKSSYLREKLCISPDTKIALHLGGIAEWFSCIEISTIFSKIDNWILVFQGYPDKEYLNKLRNFLKDGHIQNIYILDELFDSIEDVDIIVKSCDIGIAWYNNISIGFRTAGKSSGKIPAYLRFGLPVIAKKYDSTLEAIESTGCGICVDNFEEIKTALEKIQKNYEYYSNNAMLEYTKTYQFKNYSEKLLQFLNENKREENENITYC